MTSNLQNLKKTITNVIKRRELKCFLTFGILEDLFYLFEGGGLRVSRK